jgi:hypothetical protein
MAHKIPVVVLLGLLGSLGGCFDDDDQNRTGSVDNPPAAQNAAPTITGAPPATVREGEPYEFTPSAVDADGDELQFSVSRKPAWASFDPATGKLSGTPSASDVGNFTNISIAVSDGEASASLADFNITVDAIALGQATLSWMPPTQNDDGTPLTDLSGYKIYYGRNQGDLTRVVVLNNPGLTRYVIEELSPANWFFAMSAVNSQGVESNRSATVSKTVT